MSDKCPKCPVCSQNPILDVAGNIFSKDLLIPMNFTESTDSVWFGNFDSVKFGSVW